MKNALAALAAVLSLGYVPVVACPDGEHHQQTRFQAPPTALTPPPRPLVWGELNIIHTTDTHGWLLGHQKSSPPEPNYSGTFGDFASFVSHMNEIAQRNEADLLLVDTGDLHDGTGLSDGGTAGKWDAKGSDEFFARLPYDLLTIGNHDLNSDVVAQAMHTNFAKKFPGRYLTSNAYITVTDANNKAQKVPIGWQYAKFTTRKGRNVIALGVIFNFKISGSTVSVQPVEAMVTERWFTDLIKNENPHFFLLIGHMPVQEGDSDNLWKSVFDPIRKLHKDTPIIVLGGHSHKRDCIQYDEKSIALESGAFMDTVGWLSVNLTNSGGNPSFSRRYLDPNRVTYMYHTTQDKFDTPLGNSITDGLKKLFEKYNLGKVWGKSPQHYTLFRDPTTSSRSALKMFVEEALPVALSDVPTVTKYRYFVIGTGVLRYDVFEGEFNQNDQLTASPYPDKLYCIPNVSLKDAKATAQKMNQMTSSAMSSFSEAETEPHYARWRMEVDQTRLRWLASMNNVESAHVAENPTLGYVTKDKCGTQKPGDGDDTPHIPLTFVTEFPNVVTSQLPSVPDETRVDLVFLDFQKTKILLALNSVQTQTTYAEKDIRKDYTTIQTKDVLGIYAGKKWKI